ncbi:hypothetical protein PANA5342_pPANA10051 (plasmid) [Pantoea ananatis LMG 5342]|nr:hypothetical protein PANA5342_pPANA10051 [Pantoea ananatis LMG 5342]
MTMSLILPASDLFGLYKVLAGDVSAAQRNRMQRQVNGNSYNIL